MMSPADMPGVTKGQHSCTDCDFSTRKEKRLLKHMQTEHGKNIFRCPFPTVVCLHFYCTDMTELCSHKEAQHKDTRLRCFLCEYSSRSLLRWIKHCTQSHNLTVAGLGQVMAHTNKDLSTDLSENEPSNKSTESVFHTAQSHTDRSDADCDESKRPLKSVSNTAINDYGVNGVFSLSGTDSCRVSSPHILDLTQDDLQATKPGDEIENVQPTQQNNLEDMSQPNNANPNFVCEVCNKPHRTLKNLKEHKRAMHDPKAYKCEICEQEFAYQSRLKRHMLMHSEDRPHKCSLCDITFKSMAVLKAHHKAKHDRLAKPSFPCPHCDRSYTLNCTLTTHIKKVHSGNAKYVCCICDSTAFTPTDLARHMRTHSGERPYECDLCTNKKRRVAFKTKGQLIQHYRIHTQERPYKCTQCDWAFKNNFDLILHVRSHTGERPFTCNTCKMSFSRSSYLKRHFATKACNN